MSGPSPASLLLAWYQDHARNLPWRRDVNPYAVWVSEIMLQQTRVETVIPYFQRWMQRFPDIPSLADADQQAVLAVWEGLGYYGRARSIHRAAQIVQRDWHGELPSDVRSLNKLPGIGRYTAGAIASIAFGKDEPALDGNIRRVLSRLFNVSEPLGTPQCEQHLWELARAIIPPGKAGVFNQALMDLGALICTPRSPDCPNCPLAGLCEARAQGLQGQRPVKNKRANIPHHTVTAAVVERAGKVLITQRPQDGLLGGLWEFPGGKLEPGEDLASCLQREICEELGAEVLVIQPLGVYRHTYTHFRVTVHAFRCELGQGDPRPMQVSDLRWILPENLMDFPMGKIDRMIASDVMESHKNNADHRRS